MRTNSPAALEKAPVRGVMDPTPEQWERISELFEEAKLLPPPEQRAFVERVRRESGDVISDGLAELLEGAVQSTEPWEQPLVPPLPTPRNSSPVFEDGELLLGRFRIVRWLDRGGMGEVYQAHDKALGPVALKTICSDLVGDQDAFLRFQREVQLARKVTSRRVCRIHDLFLDPDPGRSRVGAFLTMELLSGTTLRKRMEQGPIPWAEAEPLILEICQGLEAIHECRIVHRDFKPGNVMLASGGGGSDPEKDSASHAVIMDFGLAVESERRQGDPKLTRSGRTPGTYAYMAPEQLQGESAKVSPATDVYALGLVIYEMLAGRRPFAQQEVTTPTDKGTSDPASRQIRGSPPLRPVSALQPGVPPHVDLVIAKCLAFDPADRYQSAGEVARALQTERREKPRVLTTRRKLMLAGGAAVASLAAAIEERERLASFWEDLLNPLPQKRHVAVLVWPPGRDQRSQATLSGVIDAIEDQLSRAEAFDSNLYVMASHRPTNTATTVAQLGPIVDDLGANLLLAASGVMRAGVFDLSLKLIDVPSGRSLRAKDILSAITGILSLSQKAVTVAADLLGIARYVTPGKRLGPPTRSQAAFEALQAADAVRKQPDDAGLEPSISKYKEAIELDPQFALAYGRLATAYCRLHVIHADAGALKLAEDNAKAGLRLDPDLVQAHLAMGWVLMSRGDAEGVAGEMKEALRIDPSDPKTLVWGADLLTRMNRLPEAEAACKRVLKERPNHWLAHLDLGEVQEDSCKYHDALESFLAASLAAPKRALPLGEAGRIQLKLGLYEPARETLAKSMALRPSAEAARCMAQAFRATGKLPEALGAARQAVKLDTGDVDQAWLELGDCLTAAGRHPEAREAYASAREEAERQLRSTADAPTSMLLILYQLKSGVPVDATASIAKAESSGATDPDSQLVKVRILELAGLPEKALEALAACMRRGVTLAQLDLVADLQPLRRDPRYSEISKLKPA